MTNQIDVSLVMPPRSGRLDPHAVCDAVDPKIDGVAVYIYRLLVSDYLPIEITVLVYIFFYLRNTPRVTVCAYAPPFLG